MFKITRNSNINMCWFDQKLIKSKAKELGTNKEKVGLNSYGNGEMD